MNAKITITIVLYEGNYEPWEPEKKGKGEVEIIVPDAMVYDGLKYKYLVREALDRSLANWRVNHMPADAFTDEAEKEQEA